MITQDPDAIDPDASLAPVTGEVAGTTPATLSTLPPIATTPPSTAAPADDSFVPEVVEAPPIVDRSGDGVLVDGTVIDVPDIVAAITEPTEVVMLNDNRQLVTTSFPSGRSTVIDLPPGTLDGFSSNSGLAASPDGTLFNNGSGGLLVLSLAGDLVEVDISEFDDEASSLSYQLIPLGWVEQPDAPASFIVLGVDEESNQREFIVELDGTVNVALAQRFGSFTLPLPSQGARLINDSGGAYLTDSAGNTNRISPGTILATSRDRVLIRECNANRLCTTVLRDIDGGNVETVNLSPAYDQLFFSSSLSPDATAVVFSSIGFSQNRTMIDLATSETVVFASFDNFQLGQAWAADSSGEFGIGGGVGIQFMHRSGTVVNLASELGQVTALAVRPPPIEATPDEFATETS